MKTKIFLALGAVIIIVGMAIVVCALLWDGSDDEASFDRITKDMTKGEVEAIFGRPADQENPLHGGGTFARWRNSESEALFVFDEKGRIRDMKWSGPPRRGRGRPFLEPLLETIGIVKVRE